MKKLIGFFFMVFIFALVGQSSEASAASITYNEQRVDVPDGSIFIQYQDMPTSNFAYSGKFAIIIPPGHVTGYYYSGPTSSFKIYVDDIDTWECTVLNNGIVSQFYPLLDTRPSGSGYSI